MLGLVRFLGVNTLGPRFYDLVTEHGRDFHHKLVLEEYRPLIKGGVLDHADKVG
jgi:hypothetical protein